MNKPSSEGADAHAYGQSLGNPVAPSIIQRLNTVSLKAHLRTFDGGASKFLGRQDGIGAFDRPTVLETELETLEMDVISRDRPEANGQNENLQQNVKQ